MVLFFLWFCNYSQRFIFKTHLQIIDTGTRLALWLTDNEKTHTSYEAVLFLRFRFSLKDTLVSVRLPVSLYLQYMVKIVFTLIQYVKCALHSLQE